MKHNTSLLLSVAALISLAAAPAYAKHDHQGKNHKDQRVEETFSQEKGRSHKKGQKHQGTFDDSKREPVQIYLRDAYVQQCPPGLAKKHNGCLPPGQAKKYAIGGMLPEDHHLPPPALIEILGPPPVGAFYAMVDNDVVLAAEGTKKIIDAITLFSAMH